MEDTTFALPATERQIAYARALALKNRTLLPWGVSRTGAASAPGSTRRRS